MKSVKEELEDLYKVTKETGDSSVALDILLQLRKLEREDKLAKALQGKQHSN